MDAIRRLVAAAAVVDASELADSSRPLDEIVRSPSSLGAR
jgi:hypothetical protein